MAFHLSQCYVQLCKIPFQNAIHLAKKFHSVHEIFDAAVDENCVFSCPGGTELLWENVCVRIEKVFQFLRRETHTK